MSEYEIKSWFEFDEHRHLVMRKDGTPVASVVFSQISDGRDNAVNCMAKVKILFGAEDADAVKPVMEYQRINLTNKTSANGWNKVVEALGLIPDELRGWEAVVQEILSASLGSWFQGTSSHADLESVDTQEIGAPFLLEPLVSSTGMTLHFSPPGTGKSMVALAIALSVATGYPIFGATPQKVGPVVYVDFEDVKSTHDQRATAMLHSIGWEDGMPHIIHFKVAGKFVDQISQIRSVVRKNKAVLVIVDSLGKARNTDPSDGDSTIKLTNAIESLGMPVLAIDHVTKADNKEIKTGKVTHPDSMMAIGSQFSTAGARLAWFFQEMSDSTHLVKRFNIHNTKHNLVAKQDARSLKMEITNDERQIITGVEFTVWDIMQFEELTVESPEQIILKMMVRGGIKTIDATTAGKATGMPRTTCADALKNNPDWFTAIQKVGRTQPFGITALGYDESSRLIGDQTAETVDTKGEKRDDGM